MSAAGSGAGLRTGLRIGTAPDSWGVWFADDPTQVPWQRFLDEVAEAGYHWIELGPYGYLPPDAERLRDELGRRDLELSGGTVFTALHRGEPDGGERERIEAVAALTAALGGRHVVVIPALWRSDATGEAVESRTLDDEQWAVLAAGHDRLGRDLLETHGLRQQFHSHADSHVGTHAEVERLLAATDPRYTNLCLDTGHLAYYLGDALRLVREHPDRIGYLHLKQVDRELRAATLKNDLPFATAVRRGIMVEPPRGEPELAPVIELVADLDPSTFAVVEQDMYPLADLGAPREIAIRTREHILATSPRARLR